MRPKQFFALLVLTELTIVALAQIPLLQTVITNSGYDQAQVWGGIGLTMLVIYSLIYALSY